MSLRPKKEPGKFQALIGGHNFDPVDLMDPVKFVEFFHEHTGRKDLVFKKIDALTYWKSVFSYASRDENSPI